MTYRKTLNSWKRFFRDKGVDEKLSKEYLNQVEYQLRREIPVILSFDHLAQLLGRSLNYLASAVNSPESHYRSFKLKKRKGGFRVISTPYPALLECQYWILNNILERRSIHPKVHGFAKNKSIITNASIHLDSKEILKIDIEDFFPSIRINKLIYIFKDLGYPHQIAFYLASLCTREGCLPQGAPTSPLLSNLAFKNTDFRLDNLCKSLNLKYSRYADDLVFSGDSVPIRIVDYINDIIVDSGYSINNNKTILYRDQNKRIITGISVSGNSLKVPKNYKRKLRQELYYISKYGFKSHVRKKKIKDPFYANSLLGKVNFVLSVEPDNVYFKKQKVIVTEVIKRNAHNIG